MRTVKQIDLEIQQIEKKRRAATDRIRYYWKELDKKYEERRLLIEGEHPQGSQV